MCLAERMRRLYGGDNGDERGLGRFLIADPWSVGGDRLAFAGVKIRTGIRGG